MARSTADAPSKPGPARVERDEWTRTVCLVLIAAVLVLGAASQMAQLLVPLVLALVVAIALRPLARWIERRGLGPGTSSILCTLLVALFLIGAAGLVVAQASRVVRNSDQYAERLSALAAKIAEPLEDSRVFQTMANPPGDESISASDEGPADADEGVDRGRPSRPDEDAASGASTSGGSNGEADPDGGGERASFASPTYWSSKIRENAGAVGGWLFRGVGGVLGILGQVVVFLFLILYILYTRRTWADRIVRAGAGLGMKLREDDLGEMGHSIEQWAGCVLMVACGYAVTIAVASLLVGLPQWPLWGLMTGLLVLVPYFGALIAGIMLVTVAAVTGGGWWAPAVMLAIYVLLQTLESYVILPLLYGKAIDFDPLFVLVGVLFFGFLWGPLGFVAALPSLVLIRGFIEVMPGSDPVNALFGDSNGKGRA